jgi:Flp pilus assembly protein TadD
LEWVVRFFPDVDATIFSNLAGVDVVLGDHEAARSALRKGRRVFPDDAGLQRAQSLLKE